MNTIKCLNPEKLIRYTDGDLKPDERRAITVHLAQCGICKKNLQSLHGIDNFLLINAEKKQEVGGKRMNKECISLELLYEYIEGNLPNEEAIRIESHLNSCPRCFHEFASLLRNCLSPITDFEKSEISKLRNISPEEQVSKIMSIVETNKPTAVEPRTREVFSLSKLWEKIRLFLSSISIFNIKWRYAVSFAALILLVLLIGYPRYNIWQSDALTQKGIAYFTEEYKITREDEPRPIGGFNFSILSRTRDHQGDKKNDSAKIAFEKALEIDDNNLLAHQYLGTYFLLIEKNFEKANYHYKFVYAHDSTNASILNDMGLLAFYRGDYDNAAKKFSSALKYDSKLAEAQYNLAFIYQKQGNDLKAKQEWEKYLKLDSILSWADIARKQINRSK